jgi:hypothetical protein
MSHESIVPIKQDVDENFQIEIATYEIFDSLTGQITNHVTKKNGKPIGWAVETEEALQIHGLYKRIHILHEDAGNAETEAKVREMRSKLQNNSFLHEFFR